MEAREATITLLRQDQNVERVTQVERKFQQLNKDLELTKRQLKIYRRSVGITGGGQAVWEVSGCDTMRKWRVLALTTLLAYLVLHAVD